MPCSDEKDYGKRDQKNDGSYRLMGNDGGE